MPPGRRSGRLTGPRAVYVDDPFQIAGINDDEDTNQPKSTPKGKQKRAQRDSSSDDEFVAGSGEEADDALEEEDEAGEEFEEQPGSEAEDFDHDEMEIDTVEGTPRKGRVGSPQRDTNARQRRADGTIVPSADETHIRGIIEPRDHLSKATYYTLTFGSDDRDLMAAIHFRMRWNKAVDVVFPSRAALEETDKKPSYLYGPTFGVHPDDFTEERTRGWDWYYDDTGERFQKIQCIETIDEQLARNYLPQPELRKHGVLLGPHDNQQLFELGYHESLDFGKAWEERGPNTNQSKPGPKKIREGWILNIGHKILTMAWAPNHDGITQYLAVVAPVTEKQKAHFDLKEKEHITPFQPSQPYPCALQIWEIRGKKSKTPTMTLDMNSVPRLRQVLCADWGDLRRISWCPMPRDRREEDEEEVKKSIGLLATVWGDGKVRVLDIKTRRGSQETEFRQYLF